ncbi:hypothetical protein [Streptomyces sp. NPDC005780]|uniref:hypothetical protein n=1 Tax=Streptomyces sp. NPDC005780 TaxID=3364730 RepID=UPI0036B283BA
MAGYTLSGGASEAVLALITAIAGGAILGMITDTVIPEAGGTVHLLTGLTHEKNFAPPSACSAGRSGTGPRVTHSVPAGSRGRSDGTDQPKASLSFQPDPMTVFTGALVLVVDGL